MWSLWDRGKRKTDDIIEMKTISVITLKGFRALYFGPIVFVPYWTQRSFFLLRQKAKSKKSKKSKKASSVGRKREKIEVTLVQQPFVCFLLFFVFNRNNERKKTYQRTNEWMRMSSTLKCSFFIWSNFVFFFKRQLEMTASWETSQNSSFAGKQYTVRHYLFCFSFFF